MADDLHELYRRASALPESGDPAGPPLDPELRRRERFARLRVILGESAPPPIQEPAV